MQVVKNISEFPIEAEMEISVVDDQEIPSSIISKENDELNVKATVKIIAQELSTLKEIRVVFYLEQLSVKAGDYKFSSKSQTWQEAKEIYDFEVRLSTKEFREGVYRLTGAFALVDQNDTTHIVGYLDGGMIQFYEGISK